MTRRAGARREVEEPLELAADRGDVALERLAVEQVALGRPPGRVADHARAAADERDRPTAMTLEAEQPEDRHQVPDVERRGPTDRSRCRPRSAGRSPGAPSRPGRRRVEDARATRARRGARSGPPAAGPAAGARHSDRRRVV